jgi:hypothetical protein
MHLSEAAARTPSGGGPVPYRTSTPGSGHADEIAPATSPSVMGLMCDPLACTSLIKSSRFSSSPNLRRR